MNAFRFGLHFVYLTIAAALLVDIDRYVAFADNYVILYFGLLGATHAVTLVLALREPQNLLRRGLFIVCTAFLSAGVFVVGWIVIAFAVHPTADLYIGISMGLTSAIGAAFYGTLVRKFWIASLSIGQIALIAATCGLATCSVLAADQYLVSTGHWQMTVAWWFAFSLALFVVVQHGFRLRMGTSDPSSPGTV